MNNKENKNTEQTVVKKRKKAWLQFIRPAALLLTSVVLFTYVTFAWMRREWTPYVEQEGLKIATGGSLLFELDGTQTDGMDIKKILKLNEDMILRPVSNINGQAGNFFTLDMTGGEGNETYKHLNLADYSNNGMQMGIENGYIEFELMLIAPDGEQTERWVYIDQMSKIAFSDSQDQGVVSNDAAKCIRISITTNQGQTWLFGADEAFAQGATERASASYDKSIPYSDQHTGVNPATNENKYIADGVRYYEVYDPASGEYRETTKVEGQDLVLTQYESVPLISFASKNGKGADGNWDRERALFQLSGGNAASRVSLTVRIWAEGTNKYCNKDISSAKIDLLLKFSSFTIDNSNS